MNRETVLIKIDGNEISVPRGTTILQAAEKLGIHIPRYCYHPALTTVGSCRICQVEVAGAPGPVIACHAQAMDGSEIFTDTDLVRRVRSGVMEFLLLNHPIDCPICDTSGECDLQNYYMTDGKHRSRLRHSKIDRTKRKRIGANVVLDQERCILCSRCVRFLASVTGTNELGFFGKGSESYIDLANGKTLDGNQYAGNVIDLCPVGALTDDAFRFRCRVWYLKRAPSVCPHCANGCNIEVHYNSDLCWKNEGKKIMRIKPRFNPHVNGHWMCDIGRYEFDFAENSTRLGRPLVTRQGGQEEVPWDEALRVAAGRLKGARDDDGSFSIALIPSPGMTNEAAYLLRKVFIDHLGVRTTGFRKGEGGTGGDGMLLRNDQSPNRLGLEIIGCDGPEGGISREEMFRQVGEGKFKVLVFFQDLIHSVPPADLVGFESKGAEFIIVLASNTSPFTELADLVLPVSPWTEDNGTWVNWQGRVQWVTPVLPPIGYSRNTAEVLAMLGDMMGIDVSDGESTATFDRLAREVKEFSGLSHENLKEYGAALNGAALNGAATNGTASSGYRGSGEKPTND